MLKKARLLVFGILCLLVMGLLAGCQKSTLDQQNSPMLQDVTIETGNQKTEDSQFVKVYLKFDKSVKTAKNATENMRITIAGERMETTVSQTEADCLCLEIPVTAITKGNLEIAEEKEGQGYSGITDESGKYTLHTFELDMLIPSGISLQDVASYQGKGFEKEVEGTWNIRNITWVQLLENGTPVTSENKTKSELLNDAIAVHGHDFLISDPTMIAETMTGTLNKHFGNRYIFTQEGNRIKGEKLDGSVDSELDLVIYEYKEITQKTKETEKVSTGSKIKSPETDREITREEQKLLDGLHIMHETEMERYPYETLTLTGDALGEMQIYALTELENLIRLSYETTGLYERDIVYTGIDGEETLGLKLQEFLKLCGVDESTEIYVQLFCGAGGDGACRTLTWKELKDAGIVFSNGGEPITCCDTGGLKGPMAVVYEGGRIHDVEKIILSSNLSCPDPHYEMHNREPHNETAQIPFTVRIFHEGDSEPVNTVTFTTEQLESLVLEHPEAAVGGYYGTIGNAESMEAMGIDGWLDYYSGINLWWLLTEQAGLDTEKGYAEFYGRDELLYTTVENLFYLNSEKQDKTAYYTMTKQRIQIRESIPMLAFGKNGYPLLKEHEHESAGYHAYNQLNASLEELGVSCEIGVVKNQSGPFVAGLGNLDGLYGGYRVETGGDCVRIDIYTR